MLSSRVSLALGTVSLVAVTSIGTAILVNDGTQRFPGPSTAGPREGMPSFQAPPLVVPRLPGENAPRPVAGPTGPTVLLPPAVTGEEPPVTGEGPAAPPVDEPVGEPPVGEPPVVAPPVGEPVVPPVVVPPLVVPPTEDQDKGRRLGWYKQQLRGKGHHGGAPPQEDPGAQGPAAHGNGAHADEPGGERSKR